MLTFATDVSYPVPRLWWVSPSGEKVRAQTFETLYPMACTKGFEGSYEEFKAECMHRICLTLPRSACLGSENDGDIRTQRLTLQKLKDFILAVISTVRSAAKNEPVFVSQAEADRRASICVPCEYNDDVNCAGCSGILTLANIFLRNRYVKGQPRLGGCGVCGCFLTVAVWASDNVLGRLEKHEYPEHCWRRHE